ncbi:MAG TPA: UvrD-helicase domain-containing protein [Candidatus Babeliales bacterium]|nr:UvrD-helicase domain-containing protein [Candidatus Babeliales bacterium]
MNHETNPTHQPFSHQLNERQLQAVLHKDGPLLVIAGAGSGKTRVITSRIVHLLTERNVPPHEIVALTFTNKAAGEMKERIAKSIGKGMHGLFIGTFHSYCLFLLKIHGHRLGYETFSIIDADDQQQLVSSILKRSGSDKRYSPKQLMYQISMLKNKSADDVYIDPFVKNVWQAYEHEKKLSKCFDFDDLLIEILHLFKTNPEFKQAHQERIRHLLVDEYQDTNKVQHELLKSMALKDDGTFAVDSLCAVGDEDQSIYSWRGATVANILEFKNDFPATIIVTIDQNYRSAEPILNVANQVIRNNTQRNPKKLWSSKEGSDRVRIVHCASGYQEGELIALGIKQLRSLPNYNSIALLYRAHYQSRTLEEALIRHSIPYVIIGGIQFYERKEIKDLLAYLRLAVNPFDRVSFMRVVNCPSRGLGDVFIEQFLTEWDKQPFLDCHGIAQHLINEQAIPNAKRSALERFMKTIAAVAQMQKPHEALEKIITQIHYFEYLKHAYDLEEAQEKIENCKELLRATKHFDEIGVSTLMDFLAEVALMQEKSQNKETEHHVYLMTLHAAKGLEFDAAMLTGLEEGIFPSNHSLQNPDGVEEERRLLYVGITRARERLLMTHARYRSTFGTMTDQTPSRFLHEIPERLAHRTDASFFQEHQLLQFFHEWLGTKSQRAAVQTFGTASKKPSFDIGSATIKETIKPTPSTAKFKLNQPVKHAQFGIGIIKNIEERGEEKIITAQFKNGLKKVKSSFIQGI